MTPSQRAAVYREAYRLIESGEHVRSCLAIADVSNWRVADCYSTIFSERPGTYLRSVDVTPAGGYAWRLTALGFAAAMAETGDL